MALKDNIANSIKSDIEKLGFELEYVELEKEGKENYVTVVIDKRGTFITTADCELVSRAIEDKVDSIVKLENGYIFEVSSAGLERKLKTIELFKKYVGERVLIKLYKKIEDEKEIEGKLISVDNDDNIIVEKDGKEICLKFAQIAAANTVYDFNFEKESN